jgi:hypothetical protein
MTRTTNRNAREFVQSRWPFKASNVTGDWETHPAGGFFVVRSYGWWVLFAYHLPTMQWYENVSKHSPTTSKHRTQTHPHEPTVTVDARTIIDVLQFGATAVVLRGERQ